MLPAERLVTLGCITGAFGIQGWVKIESYTDPPENILKYPLWRLVSRDVDETTASLTVANWRSIKPLHGRPNSSGGKGAKSSAGGRTVHVQLESIVDRTQAESLRGLLIAVPRSELPATAPGEYYWNDLIGLEAFAVNGERLGQIVEIRATAAHELLAIVDDHDGERIEHLVPMVKQRVVNVDLDGRKVTVDWDSGW